MSIIPPPPTILSILPEGRHVRAGDAVGELDWSGFRDALRVHELRSIRGKAWVDPAKYAVEANEIALREDEHRILPQDIELARHHVTICQIDCQRAASTLAWSRPYCAEGLRSAAHAHAYTGVCEQAKFILRDAQWMLQRLLKYMSKRILQSLRAGVAASQTELVAQRSISRLECELPDRMKAPIVNGALRAPRDGIIVHANRTKGRGTAETQIREGLTAHQLQPIFRLVDSRHLQLRARINESRIAQIRVG
jgi:multidrug resistance efflux pump